MIDGPLFSSMFEEMPTLRFADAIRFFETVTPDGKCFACGTDSWDISAREGNITLCFLHAAGGKLNGKKAFNLNIDCRNCGLVRVHRAEVVMEWISNNPAPDEGNDEQV